MKRYWKIVLQCLLIIVVIGTFYIHSALADDEKPRFVFETAEGNEKEIQQLVIHANYSIGNLREQVKITNDKTVHSNDLSFMQQIRTDAFESPHFVKLKKEYKTFMRGKYFVSNYFYEDEEYLAYATDKRKEHFGVISEGQPIYFDIDVLNKKTGDRTSFEVLEKTYDYISVEDVQMKNGDTLVVLTKGFNYNSQAEELTLYTFNLKKQTLEQKKPVAKSRENMFIQVFAGDHSISKERYVPFKILQDVYEVEQELNANLPEVYVYDYKTGRLNKLKLPDKELAYSDPAVYSSVLYINRLTDDGGLEVYAYDMAKDTWSGKPVYQKKIALGEERLYYAKAWSGKIYIFSFDGKNNWLHVGDLKTGKTVYEGKIKADSGKEVPLEIYNVEFEV